MKTLNTIQTLAKIGRILSRIVYIFCMIGGIGCLAGILSLLLLPESIKVGGVTVRGLIEVSEELSLGTCYASMAAGAVICAGEAVLARLAERCFKNELTAGTPFTIDGAKELMRLGICAICIPVGTRVIAEILYSVLGHFMQDVGEMQLGDTVSVGLGVMMIVASLLCRYGAECVSGADSGSEAGAALTEGEP